MPPLVTVWSTLLARATAQIQRVRVQVGLRKAGRQLRWPTRFAQPVRPIRSLPRPAQPPASPAPGAPRSSNTHRGSVARLQIRSAPFAHLDLSAVAALRPVVFARVPAEITTPIQLSASMLTVSLLDAAPLPPRGQAPSKLVLAKQDMHRR